MYFPYFLITSPWERVGPFIWIVPSLVKIGPLVLEKKILKFCECIFRYFVIISRRKRVGPFIWTNLNPLHPRCIVPSLIDIGQVVLEKIFINFVNVFSLFRNYLPLEKDRALHLKTLKSPSPKDVLSQIWLKLAQLFWRRWNVKSLRQCQRQQRY